MGLAKLNMDGFGLILNGHRYQVFACPTCAREEYLIAWPPPPFNPSEDNARLKKLKQAGEA